jgi:hypothetical protein
VGRKPMLYDYSIACLMLGATVFTGCDLPPPMPDESKVIIDKTSPNENRFSGTEFIFQGTVVTKTQTVYYLIAEDGTVCEVGLTKYHQSNIGDTVACAMWEVK